MSAIRRAVPFFVAAMTGVVSGIYIFKPLVIQETKELSNPRDQHNVISSDTSPKSRNGSDDKGTIR
ncbi:hypothetical protein GALMADRAFT_374999 [Galerina marginata CBS 339.88]|uniref:Uncharacterized protein n=1 Tax=Galerina marginata (strain CBS 339.88) TaxID=685588 RepID=A0A067U030_GALM3|nr:hypothetical protein GALMADRAFT_374999 [Galerina marginata CBS 339.88]